MIHRHAYNSLSEFVTHTQEDKRTTSQDQSIVGDERFTGTASMDDALSKAFRWDAGAERVERMRAAISGGVERFKHESRRSATMPGAIIMADYIAGHPKPVMQRVRTNETRAGRGKVTRIVANISASAMVQPAVMERRGAAVMALADAIERRGGRVEIVIAHATRAGDKTLDSRVTIKRAGNKLNLNSVAFAMSHPSMLRRLMFAHMERVPNSDTWTRAGYGVPVEAEHEETDLYIPKMHGHEPQWADERTCADWVNEYLKEKGWIK